MTKSKLLPGMKVWVHVDKTKDPSMKYRTSDFWGLIEGNYHQLYGGGARNDWAVYVLNKNQTKIVNAISWYRTHQLQPDLSFDRNKGRDMIETYEDK